MLYRELFNTSNGIFATVFATEYPEQYAKIFGNTPSKQLDTFALLNWGGRTLVDAVTADTYKDIVSSIIAVNVQGWERQAAAMLADYDPLKPNAKQTERTETVTVDESETGNTLQANKTYNDTDFTDNDRETDSTDRNRTETKKETVSESGISGNQNFAAIIEKETEVRRIKWQKNIIFALVNEITTDIYN
jgi:hypothetical protein